MNSDTQILKNLVKHVKEEQYDPFTPLLDSYLIKRDKSPKRLEELTVPVPSRYRPGGRLSPSKLCGCERQAAFVFLGVKGKKSLDPEKELMFDDGNWRHHKWDAIFLDMEQVLGFKKFKVVAIEEKVMVPHLLIAGRLDAWVEINGIPWIVDFKGINMYGFDRVFRSMSPLESHVLQLIAYMRAAKIKRGFILYDEKNSSKTKVFTVQFTNSQWKIVAKWSKRIIDKLEAQEVPPKAAECKGGHFLYERCPFASICWGGASIDKIKRYAYKDFTSVEDLWKRGLKESP